MKWSVIARMSVYTRRSRREARTRGPTANGLRAGAITNDGIGARPVTYGGAQGHSHGETDEGRHKWRHWGIHLVTDGGATAGERGGASGKPRKETRGHLNYDTGVSCMTKRND